MIKSFKAVKLNRRMTFDLQFHEDINIVTGKNGSGKTTLLKLLWYTISGNLERIIPEIAFDSFEIVTDKMTLGMEAETTRHERRMIRLKYRIGDLQKESERPYERAMDWDEIAEANRAIVRIGDASIFFPTFRRIEGGFSISSGQGQDFARYMRGRAVRRPHDVLFSGRDYLDLQQAVNNLSERLSVEQHRFVASISTEDIVQLLTSKYAEISERTNRLHMELSRFILKQVQSVPMVVGGLQPPAEEEEPSEALEQIRRQARNVTQQSEALLRPFSVLSESVARVFQYKGIKLADPVTLGDATGAIRSDVLSAGEKQMLSFLCYNAFASKSCLFIDEPEISLHVDWQRMLFPILLQQSAGNQFIVATHSPFIYSKYADKELMLSVDRGNVNADPQDDRG